MALIAEVLVRDVGTSAEISEKKQCIHDHALDVAGGSMSADEN